MSARIFVFAQIRSPAGPADRTEAAVLALEMSALCVFPERMDSSRLCPSRKLELKASASLLLFAFQIPDGRGFSIPTTLTGRTGNALLGRGCPGHRSTFNSVLDVCTPVARRTPTSPCPLPPTAVKMSTDLTKCPRRRER